MSLAQTVIAEQSSNDHLRESWRVVMSMKRSTQQFRARLTRALPAVEQDRELDPQFGDVASAISVMVRVLDWTMRDLDRLRLPDELFEAVPVQPAVRIVGNQNAT